MSRIARIAAWLIIALVPSIADAGPLNMLSGSRHYVQSGGGAQTPLFSDNFDSGSLAGTQNGWSWSYTNGGDGTVSITTARAKSGTRSLLVQPNSAAPDTHIEKRFGSSLVGGYTELWVSYWLRAENITRIGSPGGGVYNNKLMYLWTGTDGEYSSLSGTTVGVEFFQGSTDGSTTNPSDGDHVYTLVDTTRTIANSGSDYQHWDGEGTWLRVSDRNKWVHYCYRFVMGAGGFNDGLFQVYRQAEDEGSFTRIVNRPTPMYRAAAGGLRSGYLHGWADAGYTDGIPSFYYDDFQVGNTNICGVNTQ